MKIWVNLVLIIKVRRNHSAFSETGDYKEKKSKRKKVRGWRSLS